MGPIGLTGMMDIPILSSSWAIFNKNKIKLAHSSLSLLQLMQPTINIVNPINMSINPFIAS